MIPLISAKNKGTDLLKKLPKRKPGSSIRKMMTDTGYMITNAMHKITRPAADFLDFSSSSLGDNTYKGMNKKK